MAVIEVVLPPEVSARCRQYATECMAMHKASGTYREGLAKDGDFIGKVGEAAFGQTYGLEVDYSMRPAGDKGIDFTVIVADTFPREHVIDVKTAVNANHLMRPVVCKYPQPYYVQAKYRGECRVALLGWYPEWAMPLQPVKTFKFGIANHVVRSEELMDFESLERHLGLRRA